MNPIIHKCYDLNLHTNPGQPGIIRPVKAGSINFFRMETVASELNNFPV